MKKLALVATFLVEALLFAGWYFGYLPNGVLCIVVLAVAANLLIIFRALRPRGDE